MTLLTWVAVILCGASLLPQRDGGGSDAAMVKFSRAPPPLSASPSAAFAFEGREGGNGGFCSNCYFSCKVGLLSVLPRHLFLWYSLILLSIKLLLPKCLCMLKN